MFNRIMFILVFAGFIVFGIFAIEYGKVQNEYNRQNALAISENNATANIEIAKIEAGIAKEQDFDNRALDTNAKIAEDGIGAVVEIANSGFDGIVETAKSADASQTAMAGMMVGIVWGLGFLVFGVVALMLLVQKNKSQHNHGGYVSTQSHSETPNEADSIGVGYH